MNFIFEAGSSDGVALPQPADTGIPFSRHGRLLINHGSLTVGAEPAPTPGRIRLVCIDTDATPPVRHTAAEIESPMPESALVMGNFLILLCPDGMRLLRRAESSADGAPRYTSLGRGPVAPEVEFRLVREPMASVRSSIEVGLGNDETAEFVAGRISRGSALSLNAHGKHGEAVANLTEAVNAALNVAADTYAASVNRFCQPFLVRYALRLYDGTTVCQSAPVMMTPQACVPLLTVEDARVDRDATMLHAGIGFDYVSRCRLEMYAHVADEATWRTLVDEGIVRSVEVAVTRPIATWRQDAPVTGWHTVAASVSDGLTGQRPGAGGGSEGDSEGGGSSGGNTGGDAGDSGAGEGAGGAVYLGHYSESDAEPAVEHHISGEEMLGAMVWAVKGYSSALMAQAVTAANVFYTVASLTLAQLADFGSTFAEVPLAHGALASLALRSVMPDAFEPLNRPVAGVGVVFNSRLSIVPRRMLYGAPPSPRVLLPLTGGPAPAASAPSQVRVCVRLRKQSREKVVATRYVEQEIDPARPPRWFFYPDADAVEATLWVKAADGTCRTLALPLTPHPTLNGAYFWGGFAGKVAGATVADATEVADPAATSDDELTAWSDVTPVLLTSPPDCPFHFPAENAVKLPGERVDALLTALHPMSEGQFGHFPLYVFTSGSGIYVLDSNSDGSWGVLRQVAWHGRPFAVRPMEGGVVFTASGGVTALRGMTLTRLDTTGTARYGTELLTRLPALERIAATAGFGGITTARLYPVSDTLEGASLLCDDVRRLLVIYRPGESVFAHVWNAGSGTWSVLHQRVQWTDTIVAPSGQVMVVGADSTLYLLEEAVTPQSLLITDEMHADGGALWRFGGLRVRGECPHPAAEESVTLYGSRDTADNMFAVASVAGRHVGRQGGSLWRRYVAAIVSTAKRIFAVEMEN